MTVLVQCPHPGCGATYQVSEDRLGRSAACRSCRRDFTLTASSTVDAATQAGGSATMIPQSRSLPTVAAGGPRRLGRFEVLEPIGQGAFGVVYRARDPQLERDVALKLPHPTMLQSPNVRERFLREAKAAARLRHPNIVPVYDAGKEAGQYYIAAAFIDGTTLHQAAARRTFSFSEAARIARALAEALQYAHGTGTIHRDVKPENVMLDGDGVPHLMDFGLARLEDAREQLTHDGAFLGTPAYSSPEQALGKEGTVTAAADQYSLGVVLYELLTGERPFSGPPQVVLFNVIHQTPKPPSEINPAVPADLETICNKAMAKDPRQRYADCGALAEDLHRHLAGEPIQARRLSLKERGVRWARREPWLAGLSAATVLLAATVLGVIGYALAQETMLRQETQNALRGAEQARAEADRQRTLADANATRATRQTQLAKRAQIDLQQALTNAQDNLAEANRQRQLAETSAAEAESQRGRAEQSLAELQEQRGVTQNLQTEAEKLQGVKNAQQRRLRMQQYVNALRPALDSPGTADYYQVTSSLSGPLFPEDLRSIDWNYVVALLSQERPSERHYWVLEGPKWRDAEVVSCQVSVDGGTLAVLHRSDSVRSSKMRLRKDDVPAEMAGMLHVWRLSGGNPAAKPARIFGEYIYGEFAFDPGGKTLTYHNARTRAATSPGGTSYRVLQEFWSELDLASGNVRTVQHPDASTGYSSVSPNERWMAIVSEETRGAEGQPTQPTVCNLRDAATGQVVRVLQPVMPDGTELIHYSLRNRNGYHIRLAFSGDSRYLAMAGVFSPFGQPNIARTYTNRVFIWDVETGELIHHTVLGGSASYDLDVRFSPDGKRLLLSSYSDREGLGRSPDGFWFWSLPKDSDPANPLPPDFSSSSGAIFSPSDRFLAFSNLSEVIVVDTSNPKETRTLRGHDKAINAVAFSPDEKTLVSAGDDKAMRIWDVETSLERLALHGHDETINALVFSPDGKTIISASDDKTIRIWDLETGLERLRLTEHTAEVTHLLITPDKEWLISGDARGTVRLWPIGAPLNPPAYQPADRPKPAAIPDYLKKGAAYSPVQATGAPDTLTAGDKATAWASKTADRQDEWLLLEYEQAVEPEEILVYETFHPGSVRKITGLAADGTEHVLWSGKDATPIQNGMRIMRVAPQVQAAVTKIKLEIASREAAGWNEIDAVGLVDQNGQPHWAVKASASSSYADP